MKTMLLLLFIAVQTVLFAAPAPAEAPAPKAEPAAAVTRTDDIIYGRKFGMALTMDVIKPETPNGAAVIWVVSGGFFSNREETLSPAFAARLKPLLDRGYTVFTVMHGSAPQFELREIVKDIHRAVRFVRAHATDYGIDPNRIGITGGSAGGYLSVMMGTCGTDGNPQAKDPVDRASSKVQAVACFFPGTDWLNFPNPGDNVIAISERLGTVSSFRFRELDPQKKEYLPIADSAKVDSILHELSPIHHVSPQSAPMLLLYGDKDEITSLKTQGLPMQEKLKQAGVPCEIIVKPGQGHGWPGIAKDSEQLANWFDHYLKKQQ